MATDYEDEEAQEWQQVEPSRKGKARKLPNPTTNLPAPTAATSKVNNSANVTASTNIHSNTTRGASGPAKAPHRIASHQKPTRGNGPPPRPFQKPAFNARKYARPEHNVEQQRLQDDPHWQKFCRGVPDRDVRAIGTFHWTLDQPPPNNVLDRFKMQFSCWITFDAPKSTYKVFSHQSANVKSTLSRLRALFRHFQASKSEDRTLRLIMPFRHIPQRTGVKLVPDDEAGDLPNPPVRILLLDAGDSGDSSGDDHETSEPTETPTADTERNTGKHMTSKLGNRLTETLEQLQHYKGHIAMKVTYGKFLLTGYRKDISTLPELRSMMQEPQCRSVITSGLEDPALESQLLDKFVQSSYIDRNWASDSKYPTPLLSISWKLKSPDPAFAPDGLLFSDYEYEINAQTDLDRVSVRWSRADRHGEHSKMLNINLIDLQSEQSMAWLVQVTAARHVDIYPHPTLLDFDGSINMDLGPDGFTPVVNYDKNMPKARLEILSLQKRTTWQFSLDGSRYICEVSRVQESEGGQTFKTSWWVGITCNEWVALLSQNIDLSGDDAEGEESISRLFASTSEVEAFTECMQIIQGIVNGPQ